MLDTYDPARIEGFWYRTWEEQGYFKPAGDGPAYSIAIPPPNVTGSLHMGHAFQDTIMDTLIRLKRMQGYNTLWQAGTDHAGIATQLVVERQLEMEQKSREQLGREAFVAQVWRWKHESGDEITQQLRRLGASIDWSRERFTLDEGFSRAVLEVFVRLHDEGLIYRSKRLVNWDPVMRTALSDLEVEKAEEAGHLWHFRYPLADGVTTAAGKGYLVVATTRPETMLGDTAVAVHPEDDRYQALIGSRVILPLTGRRLPVIADDHIDPTFGTGCVKITPAHDFNDYEIGQRHGLEMLNIFTSDACLNELVPARYQGMERFQARQELVAELDAAGLLDRVEDHSMTVPRAERSSAIVEPYLTDQWFLAMETLAEPAVRAVEEGSVQFVPKNYENLYFSWMREIHDWCISRQLWWGHRIPAWYDPEGNCYVALSEAAVRNKYQLAEDLPLTRDPDVLETWFSSGLWTFGTLGWPEATEDLSTYHPTSVLVTGYDIIFFWVARMIMMTLKFTGEVPFHQVYVHGLVRDAEGRKMSKSKGNGLDPLDLIDGVDLETLVQKRTRGLLQPKLAEEIEAKTRSEYPAGIPAFGADALRFTFCALATTGRDVRFDTARINGYRNFCNKLWNATRFALMHTEGQACEPVSGKSGSLADRWIQSRLQRAKQAMHLALDTYRLDLAAKALYEFVWENFCDWYLELSKVWLREPVSAEDAADSRYRLVSVLEETLRLAHPMIPFITEELWQKVAPLVGITGQSIMLQPYPATGEDRLDPQSEQDMDWLQGVVTGIRNIRGEMNIPFKTELSIWLYSPLAADRERMDRCRSFLTPLTGARELVWREAADEQPVATHLQGQMKVLVPLAGLIDAEAEVARLDKELERRFRELQRSRQKLGNPDFVDRAPADVVSKEQARLAELQARVEDLTGQKQRLLGLI